MCSILIRNNEYINFSFSYFVIVNNVLVSRVAF